MIKITHHVAFDLYHIKVFKSIGNCFFFLWWANEFLALALALVIVFSFLDTALVFGLRDVQGRDL